jgi:Rha family phage regulatory protein
MEKIRSFIDLIPEINGSNFRLVDYEDNKGEKRPMYIIDRQGFSMLVNKFTGDEATIFTYKYSQAFERLIELVKQLQKENEDLYQIAVSDNCQLERQYDADKIKYVIRNISSALSSVKYTELEDTINKIIDVHTHLKKKDRYEYHRNLNATEYKKKIMAIIDKKLDVILLNKSDMLYHTVAQQLQKNLKDMYIETTNRSTSQLIANRDRKIEELTNSEE